MLKAKRGKSGKDVEHASESALLEAVATGNAPLVVKLLEEGADVDRPLTKDTVFPLLFACEEFLNVNVKGGRSVPDYLIICRILLAYGADVNAPVSRRGKTLLHLICISIGGDDHHGRSMMTELLIRYGADVNGGDGNGISPLLCSCLSGHAGCAEVLLRNGADVNGTIQGYDASAALMAAVNKSHVGLIQLLLTYGADRKLGNDVGISPLFAACSSRLSLAVVEMFLKQDDQLNRQDAFALFHAIIVGNAQIVELFWNYHAPLDNVGSTGMTVLTASCQFNQIDVVAMLLRRGADVNRIDANGFTALVTSSLLGNRQIVELLLSQGADPNGGGSRDVLTPLQAAVFEGHLEVVRLLVNAGADPNASSTHETPLYLAVDRRDHKIAQLLVDAGLDISKETWLRNRLYPPGLDADDALPVRLRALAANPGSLQHLARRLIRHVVGRRLTEVGPSLELPVTVKDYLLLLD